MKPPRNHVPNRSSSWAPPRTKAAHFDLDHESYAGDFRWGFHLPQKIPKNFHDSDVDDDLSDLDLDDMQGPSSNNLLSKGKIGSKSGKSAMPFSGTTATSSSEMIND